MAPVLENRYNASMKNGISGKIIFLSALISLVVSSCAPVTTMFSSDEDGDEIKEISVDERLQISIPIPDDSKYSRDKSVIFGEGERFTGVLYLFHDMEAEEAVNFYRKAMVADGLTEIAIVRSNFILINFDKEDRFATIKVSSKAFSDSASEITIGPKTTTTINRSLNIDSGNDDSEPFEIQ